MTNPPATSDIPQAHPPYVDAILGIWRDLLGRPDIGVSDDFFALGDHSLAPTVVARIRKTLGVDISVMDFFECRTATALAATVAARSAAAESSSAPRVIRRRPPDAEPLLSFDQQRLWMEHQLLPGVIYNVHARRRLIGPLDAPILEASVRVILARHEALRTRFRVEAGRPVAVIDEPDDHWGIRIEDVTGAADPSGAAFRLLDDEAVTPFDLAEGPLLRCLLIRLSDTEHLLGVTVHHIVSDTWSIALFVRELSALYESGGDAERADLPALAIQYQDYAVWQRGRLVGAALERQLSYWRRHLAGAPPVLALPTAQRRTISQRAEADRIECALSAAETAALHGLCRAHRVTPFMALLAGLATVFARWSGQSDVVIGIPLAGRTASGTDNLIGFFVNVLPFRLDLSGDPTFADLLDRVRRVALDGYDHADAPLDALVEDLQVARDPRRTPLFEVVLNVVGSPEAEQVTGLVVEPLDTPSLFSRFDLSVTAQQSAGRLRLHFDFASDRCDAAMVGVLVGQLHALLGRAVENPGRGILDYPVQPADDAAGTDDAEGTAVAAAAATAPAPYAAVDGRARTRDGVAVIDAQGQWSYRWLSQAADQVVQVLAQRHLLPGDRVGVRRRPSAGFVAAVLGCMKAGVRFSVVGEAGPADAETAGNCVLLDASPPGPVAAGTVDLRPVLCDPGDPVPAGPEPAASPAPAADWAAARFGFGRHDRFAVLSDSPGHLMSALGSAFGAGAALVLPDHALTGHAGALAEWLRSRAVSVAYLTPPILRALAAHPSSPRLPALTCVFVDNAGEFIPHDVDAVRVLSPGCRCIGLYRAGADGRPLAVYEVPPGWPTQTAPLRVPLGTELPGDPARLLRPAGRPAATGEVGEICHGSLRTGDLGRRWPDGSLEFVGTAGASPTFDPVETVTTLRDIPGVRDALVVEQPVTDGPPALVGYVAGPDPQADTVAMRNFVRSRLPGYLVPAQIFVLGELPRTPAGDYDRAALPETDSAGGPATVYVAPRTPMERELTEILQELLGMDRVGIADSFFELGGFSLLATQLTTRIQASFDVDLALRDVFEAPTVEELAQLIVRVQGERSGTDDLEALLAEIELGEAGPEGTSPAEAGSAEAGPAEAGPAEAVPGEVRRAEAGPARGPGDGDPAAGEAGEHSFERAVARLRELAVFAADRPDETPATTAQALWFAAAGTPRAVAATVGLPRPSLSPAQARALDLLLTRRVAGEPLAYISGRGSFMGLEFRTERGALIPRRETELLGAAALGLARELADARSPARILDLCTGAGNLAVALAVLEPRARVWAADLEAEAVAVAARNADFHDVADRVTTVRGDLFAALDLLSPAPGRFDLIVCNPPYMPSSQARNRPADAGGFEPVAAFDGGDIGLAVLYRLIAEAPRYLAGGGWLCFELGAGMGRTVEKRLAEDGRYGETRTVLDGAGTTRAILTRRLP